MTIFYNQIQSKVFFIKVILIFSISFLLSNCSDSTKNSDIANDFSLTVTLNDSLQNPLESYKISIQQNNIEDINNIDWIMNSGNSSTYYKFTSVETYYIQLSIYDYFENKICDLVNDTLEAGYHEVLWDVEDMVKDGIYKAEILYFQDNRVIFSDEVFTYYMKNSNSTYAYITDNKGKIFSEDIISFPFLYFKDNLQVVNANNDYLNDFTFTKDFLFIVQSPGGITKKQTVTLSKESNIVKFNWDNMEIIDDSTHTYISTNKDVEEPFTINRFYTNFPNPFN